MLTNPIITTLAADTDQWSALLAVFAVLSGLTGIGGVVLTIVSRLADKSARARDELARERHGEVCGKIELAHERVTETKKAVQDFRGEVAVEIAALHRADAAIALDIERRVGPIEGKLGMGRMGAISEAGGQRSGISETGRPVSLIADRPERGDA